mmetsp:Transcript_10926/g.38384  ORF Transcript_10926/g.38384 Transcript_10926/m.38384 type:complete len:364 (+) Transcript_10926:54-1145(+)
MVFAPGLAGRGASTARPIGGAATPAGATQAPTRSRVDEPGSSPPAAAASAAVAAEDEAANKGSPRGSAALRSPKPPPPEGEEVATYATPAAGPAPPPPLPPGPPPLPLGGSACCGTAGCNADGGTAKHPEDTATTATAEAAAGGGTALLACGTSWALLEVELPAPPPAAAADEEDAEPEAAAPAPAPAPPLLLLLPLPPCSDVEVAAPLVEEDDCVGLAVGALPPPPPPPRACLWSRSLLWPALAAVAEFPGRGSNGGGAGAGVILWLCKISRMRPLSNSAKPSVRSTEWKLFESVMKSNARPRSLLQAYRSAKAKIRATLSTPMVQISVRSQSRLRSSTEKRSAIGIMSRAKSASSTNQSSV